MPWLRPVDPFARPPKGLPTFESPPSGAGSSSPDDAIDRDGDRIDLDRAVLVDVDLDCSGVEKVEIVGCHLSDCRVLADPGTVFSIRESRIDSVDLSRIRTASLGRSIVTASKFAGSELGGRVVDVLFQGCSLPLANLSGSQLQRVAFTGCELGETDLFEADLRDVSFDDSRLSDVNIDRARFDRVDFRQVTELGLVAIGSLEGALIRPEQVHELALALAHESGVSIDDDPPEG